MGSDIAMKAAQRIIDRLAGEYIDPEIALGAVPDVATIIDTAIIEAVKGERERCAGVCDTRRKVFGAKSLIGDSYQRGLVDAMEGDAATIRKGEK